MRVERSTVMAPPNCSRRAVGSGGSAIVERARSRVGLAITRRCFRCKNKMPRPISRYHATHFSRLVSRRDELRRGRESRSPSFLVAATQQVRRKPQFRLAARPRSRTEASTRAPRAPRAHRAPRVPTGFGLGEPAIASAKSHRARRLTPLRLRHGTLDLAGPKHTPCLRRDARMVATSPPARVVT